ncbi:MAG: hypothetical protein J6S87_08825, partial [Bacteroidales bacterium]|nr:hypothetical protein [Bacteroidales bacterium]
SFTNSQTTHAAALYKIQPSIPEGNLMPSTENKSTATEGHTLCLVMDCFVVPPRKDAKRRWCEAQKIV